MDEDRKLKRGLKDISTLFADRDEIESMPKPQIRPALPDSCIQLISLAHPGMESSFDMSRMAAEQAATAGYSTSIVTIGCAGEDGNSGRVKGSWVKHRYMDLGEFEKNCSWSASGERGAAESSLIFLDFSWHQAALFEKAAGLLDKAVFWVTPEMECLSEVYKWMKWVLQRNTRLECLLAYDGTDEKTGVYIYEKLADMVSRRLGGDLGWFGCHPVSRGGYQGVHPFDLDLLVTQSSLMTLNEKYALSQSVRAS